MEYALDGGLHAIHTKDRVLVVATHVKVNPDLFKTITKCKHPSIAKPLCDGMFGSRVTSAAVIEGYSLRTCSEPDILSVIVDSVTCFHALYGRGLQLSALPSLTCINDG